MAHRYFSLADANALIPQLRTSLRSALQLHGLLRDLVLEINDAGYDVDWCTLHGEVDLDDEARPIDLRNLEKARAVFTLLHEELNAIESHGCEVNGVVTGMIAFPSWRDGENEVRLSWRLGDSEVRRVHEVDEEPAEDHALGGHEYLATRLSKPDAQREGGVKVTRLATPKS